MNADQQTGNNGIANEQSIACIAAGIGVERQLDDGDLLKRHSYEERIPTELTMAKPLSSADVSLTLSSLDLR